MDGDSLTVCPVTYPESAPASAHSAHHVLPGPGARVAAALVALVAAVGVWAVWYIFVQTRTGQLLDEAAYDGAYFGRNQLWAIAEPVLSVISVRFLVAVLVVAVVMAMVRRHWLLTVQVTVLMAGANLTTQLLKHVVFARADHDVSDRIVNSLPSGHTTAAASCAVALVMVLPRRARPVAAVVGAAYTAATGISTLVGAWHRPSDVVAAVLVVLTWSALVCALNPTGVPGAARFRVRETSTVSLLVGAGAVAGAVSGVSVGRTLRALNEAADGGAARALTDRADLVTAYGGGALGVLAVTLVTFGVLVLLLRAREPRIPARR